MGKVTLLGVFMYFITHFILNVGGVSGLIPLTGVPLLMISSGGSSLVASMACLGLAQNELVRLRKENNEDHSRKV
ncbi:MAG: FtsW/RodA/SpoVE family cell cycle protein [Erysipelotrichaceae bacterium]|nr:FtsW/RodA/SpoVE family cell cycle protein [Erysipelotrichaceae bacterium]